MEKNKKFEISSSSNRYIQSSKLELILRGSYANIGFLLLALLLITLFATWLYPNSFNFYTPGNLAVIFQHIPVIIIMSIGAGILMICGEFDLSIASKRNNSY